MTARLDESVNKASSLIFSVPRYYDNRSRNIDSKIRELARNKSGTQSWEKRRQEIVETTILVFVK
jgi:hypothetical protein